jgi:hypothetical protein
MSNTYGGQRDHGYYTTFIAFIRRPFPENSLPYPKMHFVPYSLDRFDTRLLDAASVANRFTLLWLTPKEALFARVNTRLLPESNPVYSRGL